MRTWTEITAADPGHSERYADRWRAIAASGRDIYGEARTMAALVEPGSRILDAGCGTGRLGGHLAAAGHGILGVDIDPVLIGHAREDFPDCEWRVGDLGRDALPAGVFDGILCAGNVLTFIDPADRGAVLGNFAAALRPGGRLATGFGAGRGWHFDDFLGMARQAGLHCEGRFATWTLRPFTGDEDFLVALFTRPEGD